MKTEYDLLCLLGEGGKGDPGVLPGPVVIFFDAVIQLISRSVFYNNDHDCDDDLVRHLTYIPWLRVRTIFSLSSSFFFLALIDSRQLATIQSENASHPRFVKGDKVEINVLP